MAFAAKVVGLTVFLATTLTIILTTSFSFALATGLLSVVTADLTATPVTTPAIIPVVNLTVTLTVSFLFIPITDRKTTLITGLAATSAFFLVFDIQEFSLKILENSKMNIK